MEGFGITTESRLRSWTQPVKSSGVDQEDLDRLKCLRDYCMEDVYYKRVQRNVWTLQNEEDYFKGSPEEMVKLENELKEAKADFGERKARRVNDERRFVIEPKARLKVVKKKVTFSDEVDFDLSRNTSTISYYKRVQRNVWTLQNEEDYFKGSPEEMVKLENELKEAKADFGERKARRVNDERRFVIEPKARLKVVKKKVTFSDEVDFDLSRKSTGTFRKGAENVPNPLFWLD